MPIVNLDLVGSYAIDQGYEWRLRIVHPGNVQNAAMWGQIWEEYAPGKGIQQFTFERSRYDAATDQTIIPVAIDAFRTRSLPLTGGGFYVYEIRLSLPGKPAKPLLGGKVHVLPTIESVRV